MLEAKTGIKPAARPEVGKNLPINTNDPVLLRSQQVKEQLPDIAGTAQYNKKLRNSCKKIDDFLMKYGGMKRLSDKYKNAEASPDRKGHRLLSTSTFL